LRAEVWNERSNRTIGVMGFRGEHDRIPRTLERMGGESGHARRELGNRPRHAQAIAIDGLDVIDDDVHHCYIVPGSGEVSPERSADRA
jgi:hypothetical protein